MYFAVRVHAIGRSFQSIYLVCIQLWMSGNHEHEWDEVDLREIKLERLRYLYLNCKEHAWRVCLSHWFNHYLALNFLINHDKTIFYVNAVGSQITDFHFLLIYSCFFSSIIEQKRVRNDFLWLVLKAVLFLCRHAWHRKYNKK